MFTCSEPVTTMEGQKEFVRMFLLDTTDLGFPTFLDDVRPKLSKRTLKKLARAVNSTTARRFILSELLIRWSIVQLTDIQNSEIEIESGKHGKPRVKATSIEFNLSHAGNWIVCGLSSVPIGVDIERLKQLSFYQIAKRFFTKQEQQYIMEAVDVKSAFFEIWTLKESYLKCLGFGLDKKLTGFNIEIIKGQPIVTDQAIEGPFYLQSSMLDSAHLLSYCVRSEIIERTIKKINLKHIQSLKW